MKKVFFIVCASVFFLSCDNENLETNSNSLKYKNSDIFARTNSENLEFYDSIVAQETEDQKLIFSSLTAQDRYTLWLIKLDNFKSNNELNSYQSSFIDELISELRVEMFTDNSDLNSVKLNFINQRKDYYLNRAKALFGENEGWYLLTKIENINHAIAKIGNPSIGGGDPITACSCEKSSECIRPTGLSWIGISWEYGTCSRGDCYVQSFLGIWESDNVGKCNY